MYCPSSPTTPPPTHPTDSSPANSPPSTRHDDDVGDDDNDHYDDALIRTLQVRAIAIDLAGGEEAWDSLDEAAAAALMVSAEKAFTATPG